MHLLLALTMVAPALADNPPGADPSVPVNSQPSLAKALGPDAAELDPRSAAGGTGIIE